jgi:hypothetical protein
LSSASPRSAMDFLATAIMTGCIFCIRAGRAAAAVRSFGAKEEVATALVCWEGARVCQHRSAWVEQDEFVLVACH